MLISFLALRFIDIYLTIQKDTNKCLKNSVMSIFLTAAYLHCYAS